MIAEKITFGSYQQSEFNLLPKEVIIGYPNVNTTLISIPGRNGTLDLTESLTDGEIIYADRELTVTMYCFAESDLLPEMEAKCRNALHGRKMKIFMDCDPDYYYLGRLYVDWKSASNIDTVTINAICDPYKYKLAPTIKEFNVSGSSTVEILNSRMPTSPKVTVSSRFTVTINGEQFIFDGGTTSSSLVLREGVNSLSLSGNGHIKFEYQEGDL